MKEFSNNNNNNNNVGMHDTDVMTDELYCSSWYGNMNLFCAQQHQIVVQCPVFTIFTIMFSKNRKLLHVL